MESTCNLAFQLQDVAALGVQHHGQSTVGELR
eukprot:CAMPEP_0180802806 /NCGR_PEP_ID=MMETSP1038_2-20121128/60528_1 /TAXON_ID=632150 /ORGANISM="Azadinium spinosum, Strain 3D9" /LENGTH=31 /DNA_ID= /DNA_START= /DNA_END= /DNA_ORIENTATION=